MSKKNIQLSFFAILTAGLLSILFFIAKPYFGVVFISGIFAVSFYPLYEKLIDKLKGRKSLASASATFLILVFVIIPVVVLSTFLIKEAIDLYNSMTFDSGPGSLIYRADALVNEFDSLFSAGSNWQVDVSSYAKNLLNWVISHFGSVFAAVFGGIFNFVLMLISLYYLFLFGDKIKDTLKFWSPLPDEYDEEFIQTLKSSVNAVLRGRVLVSVAQGVFIGIGFFVFGVGSPVLWGFIGGIASLIPVLGTSIVTVPAIAYLFLMHKVGAGIGLLIWSAIAIGLVDNFISLIFFKDKIKVHPLVILFSILGGVEVFGAIGFLVGPIAVSAFLALMKIYPFIMQSYRNQ